MGGGPCTGGPARIVPTVTATGPARIVPTVTATVRDRGGTGRSGSSIVPVRDRIARGSTDPVVWSTALVMTVRDGPSGEAAWTVGGSRDIRPVEEAAAVAWSTAVSPSIVRIGVRGRRPGARVARVVRRAGGTADRWGRDPRSVEHALHFPTSPFT